MGIRFDAEDWERIRNTHEAWWKGTLDRPLIHAWSRGESAPERSRPCAPVLTQATCADFTWSPGELIDRLDYELSLNEYYADSYPRVNFDCFGPGVAAAFCGARLSNETGSVWFFPAEQKPVEKISIRYDPENIWVKRIKDIYRAGGEKWKGNVLMTVPDLGGVLDIVATFAGTENLLFALHDAPEEVLRLTGEAHTAFMEAYRDLGATLEEIGNPGCSDWDGLYSREPSYVLQCDFSYMIGPEMFRRFVYDDLKSFCGELVNTIYHLDGTGQLLHLPQLLTLDRLRAIQWVPGDGKPLGAYWIDVYRQIVESGRGCEIVGDEKDFLEVYNALPDRLFFKRQFESREDAQNLLRQVGVPMK